MKGAGMLVVSLRGLNLGFCSHLGCSVQKVIIFSRKVLFYGCTRRNIKSYVFSIGFIYSIHLIKVENDLFQESKKGWATPKLVSVRGLIQNSRRASPPLHMEVPPGYLCLYLYTKRSCTVINKIPKKFHQAVITIRPFLVIFARPRV